MKKKNLITSVISILFILPLLFGVMGYRLTALQAAKTNHFVSNKSELVDEYDIGSDAVFLFKNDYEKMYRTVLVEKSGFLYRSRFSTYMPYSTDKVQTIGAMSYKNNDKEFTFLVIESHDDNVTYIESGVGFELKKQEVVKGEKVSFLFPFNKQVNLLNATAYDKRGKKLYVYGYPENVVSIDPLEDLRWHKVEQ
jgi:hypothetical protein